MHTHTPQLNVPKAHEGKDNDRLAYKANKTSLHEPHGQLICTASRHCRSKGCLEATGIVASDFFWPYDEDYPHNGLPLCCQDALIRCAFLELQSHRVGEAQSDHLTQYSWHSPAPLRHHEERHTRVRLTHKMMHKLSAGLSHKVGIQKQMRIAFSSINASTSTCPVNVGPLCSSPSPSREWKKPQGDFIMRFKISFPRCRDSVTECCYIRAAKRQRTCEISCER